MLTNRQQSLLNTIVEDFVESGMPVGSKALMANHQLTISPATIRAEMKRLEAQGFIEKTHTSSGRRPSVEGYKHYIRSLQQELHSDAVIIHANNHRQLAEHMAEETQYVSVITGYHRNAGLSDIHLTAFHNHLLLIVVYQNGDIDHQQIIWQKQLTQEQLTLLNRYLYERLDELNNLQLEDDFQPVDVPVEQQLLKTIISWIIRRMTTRDPVKYIAGRKFIFDSLPSNDIDAIKHTLTFIDSSALIKKLNSMNDNLVNVKIGQEIDDTLQNVSLITAPVVSEGFLGRLAVIGPVQMSYRRVFEELKAL
ncbi:heat-inducible transcription repressor HrcA [Macrococcus equipercicus]|uniref:Heat-inducible transcription repressor HrcA n=1 Tax=Macrococcus equipercicus TaxID=69967 RepID=A0ABQ6R9U7_9STAP|nr:heat-inducible transcriptional repressor HrcA [Macrococcus equipercicus]KAA1040061.1 heat-inducible transcription repressor HrcA [Macrococcus equipercicus]